MRTVLLTTDTAHHFYFAQKVGERFPWTAVFVEQKGLVPPFPTDHPFEKKRESYELAHLTGGRPRRLAELGESLPVETMNAPASVRALRDLAPDVVVSFGTGKLQEGARSQGRLANLNLHGGNPETYRGLDNHLWAIYHGDFAQLITTLHFLASGLDTGDIVLQKPLKLFRGMGLHELRSENTRVCVDLVRDALERLSRGETLPRRPPREPGRYYSFMPTDLKTLVVEKFEKHTAAL